MKKIINNIAFSLSLAISVTAILINLYIARQDYRLTLLKVGNYYTAQSIGRLPGANDQVRELYRGNRDSLTSKDLTDGKTVFRKNKIIKYFLSPSNSK